MFTNELLVELNQKGLFLSPAETAEQFLQRILSTQELEVQKVPSLLFSLFKTVPDWIAIEINKKGLMPWEAAATWIEESAGKVSARIQVKSSLKSSLGEVISHEMVHVMRSGFNQKHFEEILAYQTSSKWLRRYFGPLFLNPGEVNCFLVLIFLNTALPFIEILFEVELFAKFFFILPLLLGLFFLIRLFHFQNVFKKCLNNIKAMIKNPEESLAVALRLTDCEIKIFAKSSFEELNRSLIQKKELDLRWRQIILSYFKHNSSDDSTKEGI